MTRQLVERLIGCVALAESEWDHCFEPEDNSSYAREYRQRAKAAAQDKQWLFRMRDWFDARAGE
jgi:hypothetical protein